MRRTRPGQQAKRWRGGWGCDDGGHGLPWTCADEHDVPRPVARAAKKGAAELIGNRAEAGKAFINEAAALEQADELLGKEG